LSFITFNLKSEYKNKSSIQSQIYEKYKTKKINLIPNNRGIGACKAVSYCSLEEFNNNNMNIRDINIDRFISELSYFIKQDNQLTLT